MITSRPQPEWIAERLRDLEEALADAHLDIEKISRSITQLDPVETAAQLKQELRAAEHRLPAAQDTDGARRISAIRRRYAAVHDLMNQRHEVAQRVADTLADLELLAVESMCTDFTTTESLGGLDDQLERLELDLDALRRARDEVRSW